MITIYWSGRKDISRKKIGNVAGYKYTKQVAIYILEINSTQFSGIIHRKYS